jgi:anti-anti-sigma factor
MGQNASGLDVAAVRAGSAVTLAVAGELDLATGHTLVERVGAVIAEDPPGDLILDLAELRFCDSVGINAMVRLRKLADEHGWQFAVVHPQSTVRRVLELTGLHAYLNLDREHTV